MRICQESLSNFRKCESKSSTSLIIFARLLQWPQTSNWKIQFLFICSTWITHIQNVLDTSEPRPKQTRRPEPRKHTKELHFGYLGVFNLGFLLHCATFFEPKGRLHFFWNFATECMLINAKGSPFSIFGTMRHFPKENQNFLLKSFVSCWEKSCFRFLTSMEGILWVSRNRFLSFS